jgi:hypothetical protein
LKIFATELFQKLQTFLRTVVHFAFFKKQEDARDKNLQREGAIQAPLY